MISLKLLLTIAGLAALTLLTRGAFLLPRRPLPLPGWLQQGLRHAPVGALAAVVLPELLLEGGQPIASWRDAQLIGALVGTGVMLLRRSILATIVTGTATMLLCRLGLGW